MEAEYTAFGQNAGATGVGEFIATCAKKVACERFGQDYEVIRFMIASLLYPTRHMFDGSILVEHQLIPFGNDSEAFMYLTRTLKLQTHEIRLSRIERGRKVSFCLSLEGLKKCAAVFDKVGVAMLHAQWVVIAFDERKKIVCL